MILVERRFLSIGCVGGGVWLAGVVGRVKQRLHTSLFLNSLLCGPAFPPLLSGLHYAVVHFWQGGGHRGVNVRGSVWGRVLSVGLVRVTGEGVVVLVGFYIEGID